MRDIVRDRSDGLIGPKGDHGSDTWIGHVLSVARVIEGALDEGFTTVRYPSAPTR